MNNTYKVDSINITGFEQNVLQGNNWQKLLNDSQYKDELIEMIKHYVQEFGSGILPRSAPFIITSGSQVITWL